MLDFRLYLAQRISAMILAPLVLLHLGVMIYAVQGGLSAEEILGRTRDSLWWGSVYGLFVLAVAVHAAIGLRVIVAEWFGPGKRSLDLLMWLVMLGLLTLGGRAVYAVTLA
ncbi:MAG: succinate dehydrogenase [Gammaproteobacteria bacterium]|nr:succinate dehydrogenase [Gammaproteobacteria bacterium]